MGDEAFLRGLLPKLSLEFAKLGLKINMAKCVTWSPGLALKINVTLTCVNDICLSWQTKCHDIYDISGFLSILLQYLLILVSLSLFASLFHSLSK